MVRVVENVLSRREIENLIAEGKKIIIVDDKVLKIDAWVKYHPGGEKVIMHMVGRDATDEVTALHSQDARRQMKKFEIGRIEGPWVNFRPPISGGKFRVTGDDSFNENFNLTGVNSALSGPTSTKTGFKKKPLRDAILDPRLKYRTFEDGEAEEVQGLYPSVDYTTQREIIIKYRELNQRLREKGFYECNYLSYGRESIRYCTFFALFLYCLYTGWYKLSAVFVGIFWHQLTFAAHDAGHMGITHNFMIDTMVGLFIADVCGGLSIGWWKRSHNVHHIVTNEPDHDPDIQYLPFFALDKKFFKSIYSTYYDHTMEFDRAAEILVKIQHWLYYPILLFGRFNLYRLSWQYIIMGLGPKKGITWWHRYAEAAGMFVFWTWYGYGVVCKSIPTNSERVWFVLISHMITAPLHVQITLSHFAMDTSDFGVTESFPQKMLRTTMDVDCPTWLDFFHGGLQFQAVHHLYPRMPRHNLREAQKYIIEFCKEVGIPYACYGFYDANKQVVGRLAEVGRQAAIFKECEKYCMEHGSEALH
ncbi:hypothetical protein ABW20_dc0100314 [Dactylellina cionopaga]|nr:hypothetical protein ABW20_dc0100314 [Dactylellina cionopaga]